MREEIRPALTPEEWAKFAHFRRAGMSAGAVSGPRARIPDGRLMYDPAEVDALAESLGRGHEGRLHIAAALCLVGQPFGFTWEDVDTLMVLAPDLEKMGWVKRGQLQDLANRLAALLPPREEG